MGYRKKKRRKIAKIVHIGSKTGRKSKFSQISLKSCWNLLKSSPGPKFSLFGQFLKELWPFSGHFWVILTPFSLIYYIGKSDDDPIPSLTSGQISWPLKINPGILYTVGKQKKFSTKMRIMKENFRKCHYPPEGLNMWITSRNHIILLWNGEFCDGIAISVQKW